MNNSKKAKRKIKAFVKKTFKEDLKVDNSNSAAQEYVDYLIERDCSY